MQALVMVDPSWFYAQMCGVEGGSFMQRAGAWSGEEALLSGMYTNHSAASSSACCLAAETVSIKPAAFSHYGEVDLIWIVSFGYLSSTKTNDVFYYTINRPWQPVMIDVLKIFPWKGESWNTVLKYHDHLCRNKKQKTLDTFSTHHARKLS